MIYHGDCLDILKTLPDASVHCCVTSPPYYGLRDYGVDGQIGLEETPESYVAKLVTVFREVRRVLRDDGTLWLNLGDSYAGSGKCSGRTWEDGKIPKMSGKQHSNTGSLSVGRSDIPNGIKPKDLCGIPWRVAFALQADGWYLRQDIIWAKPNPMPESVKDRCTKAHEYIFLLSKTAKYFYDADAVKEEAVGCRGGIPHKTLGNKDRMGDQGLSDGWKGSEYRNRHSVWTITTHPYKGAHFATFPEKLIEPCIKAGCPVGGTVIDPFFGAGTVGVVAGKLGREYIGIELNPAYVEIAEKRIANTQPLLQAVSV